MNSDTDKSFKTFLKRQKSYFLSVVEQEEYQYNIQGINDHVNDILKLIFNDIDDLTDKELNQYRISLLRALTQGFDQSSEVDQVNHAKDAPEDLTEQSRVKTVLKKYLEISTK